MSKAPAKFEVIEGGLSGDGLVVIPSQVIAQREKPKPSPKKRREKANIQVPNGQIRVSQSHDELSQLCSVIMELQAKRKFWISLQTKQTNAAGAYVRRQLGWKFDMAEAEAAKLKVRAAKIVSAVVSGKTISDTEEAAIAMEILPLYEAMKPVLAAREAAEGTMRKLARKTPVHAWQQGVLGLGELGLAVIIGECGNIGNYSRDALRKRLGLAPVKGKSCSRWRLEGGLSADEWTQAGYSPKRRAQIHGVVTEPLIRSQAERKDKKTGEVTRPAIAPYGARYHDRRKYTEVVHPEWAPIHSHMDALAVMTTKLIDDLHREWIRSTRLQSDSQLGS